MSSLDEAILVIDHWCRGLQLYQDKLPAKGTVGGALHVLQRLRANYDLHITAHVAAGEAQITGLSGKTLKTILASFGEMRGLSAVGGRSNRGLRGDIARLLEDMRELRLEILSDEVRDGILKGMQKHLVSAYVSRFFAAKRVKLVFVASSTTASSIDSILDNAKQSGKAGAVAEYLVGAKLSLRFPNKVIRNKGFNTSDTQGGYSGDFEIGNTVFHVTVSPMPELYVKLKENLDNGKRVYLLVPRSQVVGAGQNVELLAKGKIAVEAIESFIGTNVDELAGFDGDALRSGFRRLLEAYNSRVDAVELDKSLLIEIPPNLD